MSSPRTTPPFYQHAVTSERLLLMGKVIVKRETPHQSFARLELNNGYQVMISIAQAEVKVIKMKWAGMLAGWPSRKSPHISMM